MKPQQQRLPSRFHSRLFAFTLLSIPLACLVTAPAAQAQTVYRCGNTYSQSPCPQGKLVEVDDSRTATQKSANDSTVERTARTADAMEKARLKEEAKPTPVNYPPGKPQPAEPAPEKHKLKKGKKQLELFTATAPQDKKKSAGKNTSKKKAKADGTD